MKKPTQQQLADELGVSRRTIANWKSEGVDTSPANLPALKAKADASKSRASLSEEILQARLRKLTAEAAAKEHALLVEEGRYVTKESQEREGLAAGQIIKSLILKIPADLPQILVGLEYPEAVKKCEDYAYQILTEISDSKTYDSVREKNE